MAKKTNKKKKNNKRRKMNTQTKLISLVLFIFIFYFVLKIVEQEKTLKEHKAQNNYLSQEIVRLEKEQASLKEKKEIINSDEYIENMAREKCNMYMPNERVYVDSRK